MKENNIEQLPYSSEKEQKIDIKAEFLKLLGFWKFFVLSIMICLVVAFVYMRYTDAIYKISCTILIKDDSKSRVANDSKLVTELDLFGKQTNIHNEMGIIKSKSLARQTVNDLGLYVSYYHISTKLNREMEIYNACPFRAIVDTSHIQLIGVPILISYITGDKISLLIEDYKTSTVFDFSKRNAVSSIDLGTPGKVDTIMRIGSTFTNKYFSFKIISNVNYTGEPGKKTDYTFKFFDPIEVGTGYSGMISASPIEKDASMIEITCTSSIPDKAIDYLNRLSENYINIDLGLKNLTAIKTINFIDAQLGGITDSLNSVEDVLENFRTANKIIDIPEESKAIITKLADQDQEKVTVNIELRYYEYILKYLKEQDVYADIVTPSKIGLTDMSLSSLVSELIALSVEKTKLAISSTTKNPYYNAIETNITATKKALQENVENSFNVAKIALADVNKRIAESEVEVNKMPKTQRQLLSIQRKFNISAETYNFLLQKKAEAGISKASNLSDNRIIDRAEIVEKTHPKKQTYYLMALIIGFVVPLVIIKIFDYLNDTIQDKKDIEARTSLSLLGAIAHSKYNSPLVVVNNPRSMISETIRSIKANLDFVSTDKGCNIITFTSTISEEGKTFSSINLSCAFAISDKKTLLIGADLRKPKIYKDFNLTNENGLTSYLIGKAQLSEVIKETAINNLYVITSGPVPPNPSELLGGLKMKELLIELRKQFDCIIIDTPPIGIVTDALFLMRISDVNLYVVRHNYTSRKVLNDLNGLVKTTGIKNVCLILNDVSYKRSKYGKYYNRYGYTYSSYDSGYYEE